MAKDLINVESATIKRPFLAVRGNPKYLTHILHELKKSHPTSKYRARIEFE